MAAETMWKPAPRGGKPYIVRWNEGDTFAEVVFW